MEISEARLVSKLTLILIVLLGLDAAAFAVGKVDTTFGTGGSITVNAGPGTQSRDLDIQADGKILVAGNFASSSANAIFVARYLSNGQPDIGYGNGGVAVLPLAASHSLGDIEVQPDGKVVGVGTMDVSGGSDFFIFRLNADGTPDAAFGGVGYRVISNNVYDYFNKVTVQPDGKIVAVGQSLVQTFEFTRWAVTMRFTAAGDLDRSFNRNGISSNPYTFAWDPGLGYYALSDVEILNDGRVMTLGTYSNGNDYGYYIQMLNPGGSIDTSFANQGIQINMSENYKSWYTDAVTATDAEILTDGSVVIASRSGLRVTDFNTFDRSFRQYGYQVLALPDGKFATVTLPTTYLNAPSNVGGTVKIHSRQNFISSAYNLWGFRIARQADGKFLFLNSNGGGLVTRGTVSGSQGNRMANFNKDHRADPTIFRPSEKNLYAGTEPFFIRSTQHNLLRVFPEFAVLDDPVQRIVFREVTVGWGNTASNTPGTPAYFTFDWSDHAPAQWGVIGDIPYGGDFNGDGFLDMGVFRPSTGMWWGFNDAQFIGGQNPSVQWGEPGDKPVPADYDGDGATDFAVYRPSNGTWWVRRSSDNSYFVANFGLSTDIPLTGDFDGDGMADFTVYRPAEGAWYQFTTTEGFKYNVFGLPTDTPVPNDYDGDGRWDIAVFRGGVWHILQSGAGYRTINWGVGSDILVTTRYDQ